MTSTVPPTSSGPSSDGVRTISWGASGTLNQNVEPLPGLLVQPISPPSSSMMVLQIESPRPVPPISRVMAVSTR